MTPELDARARRAAAMRVLALFAVGGVIGFVIDAAIVQVLVKWSGWNPYATRLLSFLVAATGTWLFNRTYTFSADRRYGLLGEWARYLLAMSGGFAVNYGTYSFLVFHHPAIREQPVIAVAAGSLAGMVVNFVSSRFWIFRKRRPEAEAPAPPP